jgi:hypothetical protein
MPTTNYSALIDTLPEFTSVNVSFENLVTGEPIPFEVSDDQYFIRQPLPYERDAADREYEKALLKLKADPEIQELQQQKAPEAERELFIGLAEQMRLLIKAEEDPQRIRYWERRINRMYTLAETRTAAGDILDSHPARVRNRWLASRLLLDKDKQPVAYNKQPIFVQDAALRIVSEMMLRIKTIPFFSSAVAD